MTVQGLSLCTNGILICKRHSTLTPSLTSVIDKLLREQVPGKTFTVLYMGYIAKLALVGQLITLVNSLRQALLTSTKPSLSNTTFVGAFEVINHAWKGERRNEEEEGRT